MALKAESPNVHGSKVVAHFERSIVIMEEIIEPNDFHFMRYVRCLDTGIECMGYGEVMLKVQVVPRKGR